MHPISMPKEILRAWVEDKEQKVEEKIRVN